MTREEYDKVKNFSYEEYCNYLMLKYKQNSSGLFKHHIYENIQANLSNNIIRKHFIQLNPDKLDYANATVYCDYLEHLLLHIMIGEQTNSRRCLGLGGAINYIIPQLNSYFNDGTKVYSDKYYQNINRDLFNILVERCNNTLNKTRIALDFNDTLYKQVEYNLNTNNRALIVLGTGLGKTTTALQYLWSNKCRALVIVPNKLIQTGWEEYSDWVDTITYQSFSHKFTNLNYNDYGLVILDEAHHSAYDQIKEKGAKTWSKGINYILDKGIKVLGLTATPERSDKINIEKTIFKDCVCEGLAIEDAIEKNIIYPFSYITALYDTDGLLDEYKDCDNKELVGQLNVAINNTPTLKQILLNRMPKGKRKGIIFIQDSNDIDTVEQIMKNTFPDCICKIIYSKNSQLENDKAKKWFEQTDEGYLIAINMISEGAHYKGVNTIIMFRKTSSYLVFTQQLGRIITLTKNENPNAIVFDLVNNINNVEYNSLEDDLKQTHNIKRIVEKLKNTEAAISNQIIIADESNEIVDAIRKIKDHNYHIWTQREKDLLTCFYAFYQNNNKRVDVDKISKLLNKDKTKVINMAMFLDVSTPRVDFTEEENKIIKNFYPKEGGAVYKRLNNRTRLSVMQQASKLNISYNDPKKWTENELSILKKYYEIEGKNILNRLPSRTLKAIQSHATKLNLKYGNRRWNDTQTSIIKKEYVRLGGKKLIEKYPELFRGKSAGTLNTYAKRLGLKVINAHGQKPVICIELDKTFNSVKEAQEFTGVGSVCAAIKNNSTCGGYHWCYADDGNTINKLSHFKGEQPLNRSERQQNNKCSKKVICVETGVVYKSLAEVRRKENLFISYALKDPTKTTGGYHWKYIEE